MLTGLLTNRLSFLSNAKYVLNLIKANTAQGECPPQFSLESIRPMPKALWMRSFSEILPLLALNIDLPPLEEKVRRLALAQLFGQPPSKADKSTLRTRIEEIAARLQASAASHSGAPSPASSDKTALELFEQAVSNYTDYGYFNQYDWRMTHWGTLEDIRSVVAPTFELPTSQIEFTTLWTPPIAAIQALTDIFPSVRFELSYRYASDDPWTMVEIFPTRPFGY